MGILSFQIFFVSSETNVEISVAMYPGETALARAKPTHSTANDLPKDVGARQKPHIATKIKGQPGGQHDLHIWLTPALAAL